MSELLAEILSKNYISIVEVNLCTGNSTVLKSDLDPEFVGHTVPWNELILRYVKRRTYAIDHDIVLSLTLDKLETIFNRGQQFSFEVRCVTTDNPYEWSEIMVSILSATEKKLLVTTRNINENRMLKSIINLYVYNTLDYFLLLDATNNSYTMFSQKDGNTTLPPTVCNDYKSELLYYNKKYVLPEDFERVTANMQIPHVIEMLEKSDKYTFQSGGITNSGEYRRTQVQFQYYDKAAQLILLTRMDITQAFHEEQNRLAELSSALRDAQHDALTGIYNQKATSTIVTNLLTRQYRNNAALLFLDVDNFKMVNDTLGHQEGDKLLQFLANRLYNLGGRSGIAGRIGGDEFLLFLPSVSANADIKYYGEQICHIFETYPNPAVKKLPLSCSVGIATYPKDGTDYDTLVHKADQALYTSKRYGKRQYYFYSLTEEEEVL